MSPRTLLSKIQLQILIAPGAIAPMDTITQQAKIVKQKDKKMKTKELISILTQGRMGAAADLAKEIKNPVTKVTTALKSGCDMSNWDCDNVPGAIRFMRLEDGEVVEQIGAVNAPESERGEYEPNNPLYPTTMLMLG